MEDPKIQKKNKNFPELEDDEDEDEYLEEDYELSAKFCPYLQARSFFQKFFPKNATLEYLENLYKNNPNFSKYHSLPDYIHLKSRKKENKEKNPKKKYKKKISYKMSIWLFIIFSFFFTTKM
jgi:hypothetical protein